MKDNNLIERYVHEVGAHLPAKTRHDVQQELRSLLQDAAAERGLSETDSQAISALLREYGHPEVLAASYQKEKSLIGPWLYPAFRLSYTIAAIVVGIVFAIGFALQVTQAGFSAAELLKFVLELAQALIFNLGVVVAVFVGLQAFGVGQQPPAATTWDPAKLPQVQDPDRVNRTEVLVGMLFTLLALLVFNFAPQWIGIGGWQDGRFELIPVLSNSFLRFVPLMSALWLAELTLKAAVYRSNRWSKTLRWVQVALNAAAVALLYTLVRNAMFSDMDIVNSIIQITLSIAMVVTALETVYKAYQLLTRKEN